MAELRSLTGWGRTAPTTAELARPGRAQDIAALIRAAGPRGILARGLGRSYGDAAQNAGGTVVALTQSGSAQDGLTPTGRAPSGLTPGGVGEGIGSIDPDTGELTCGAGISLDALLRTVVPQGWFVPVTPGTRQVTLGGAVAADVHGKNHHREGTISAHIVELGLLDGNGERRRLRPADDLFWAVAGGMGLSGVIVDVRLRLRPVTSSYLTVRTERTADLDTTMAQLLAADASTYSVAWIDNLARGRSLGRGVVTSGEHTPVTELPARRQRHALAFAPGVRLAAPPWVPPTLLNRYTIAAFNEAYFRAAPAHPRTGQHHAASFFHPLDAVRGWNRLYGRPGLVQYQFLTPDAALVRWALEQLASAHAPSFLSVLKRFGPGNRGPLSFPQAGWTLTVDLPGDVADLHRILDRIDDRVAASGGRIYLAKDSRLRPELLPIMYPELDRWRQLRAELDPRGVFASDLSRRLSL